MNSAARSTRLATIGVLVLALGLVPQDWPAVEHLRVLIAIPAVLALPGLAIYRALPIARDDDVAGLAMHACALSVVATIASGLLLTVTPWGISGRGFLICLGGITVVAAASSLLTRSPRVEVQTPRPAPVLPGMIHVAMFGIAAILLMSAVRIAWSGATVDQDAGVVALWLYVDPSPAVSEHWLVTGVNQPDGLGSATYRVELRYDDDVLLHWDNVAIDAGETWQQRLRLNDYIDAWSEPIDVYLYRASDGPMADPIRWVRLNRPSNAQG